MTDEVEKGSVGSSLEDFLKEQSTYDTTVDVPPTLEQAMMVPEVKALVEAATPYISPMQTADYAQQLRQHEALCAALARINGRVKDE